ncbi:hypothetical protein AMECASPLE_037596 [Ameca splendens]|uniref:Uncharacterized protein n=1 Tax=Ameca splendens TaxID=208324 RepID=A0ABV0Z6B5_9TELE
MVALPSIVAVIKRTIKDLIHGTQQHPHVTVIATKTAMDINNDIINPFQCPNKPVIQSSNGLSIPECSCIVADSVFKPSKAFETEPSGAVLLGIKVQHISPNIAQTPPFSANTISNPIRFCTVMREVGDTCSDRPSTASLVRLARRKTL